MGRPRFQLIDAEYAGPWELPVMGTVTAPTAVLIRPDGYVTWIGDETHHRTPRSAHHLVRTAHRGIGASSAYQPRLPYSPSPPASWS